MQWNGLKDRPKDPQTNSEPSFGHSASSSISHPLRPPSSSASSSSSLPFLSLAKSPFRKSYSARSSPTASHSVPLLQSNFSGFENPKLRGYGQEGQEVMEDVVEIGFDGNGQSSEQNIITLGTPISKQSPTSTHSRRPIVSSIPRSSSLRPAPPLPLDAGGSSPSIPQDKTPPPTEMQEEASLGLADQSAGSDDLGSNQAAARPRRRSDTNSRTAMDPPVSTPNGALRDRAASGNGTGGIDGTSRSHRAGNESALEAGGPRVAPDRGSSRNAAIPVSRSATEVGAKDDATPVSRRSNDGKAIGATISRRRSLKTSKHRGSQNGDGEPEMEAETQERRERRKAQALNRGEGGDVLPQGDGRHARSSRTIKKERDRRMDKEKVEKVVRDPVMASLPNAKVGTSPKAAMYFSAVPFHGFPPPQPLRAHTATLVGHCIYVIGGTDTKECWNGIARFNTETYAWNIVSTAGVKLPKLRAHSATLVGKLIYVLMGGDGGSYSNEVWVLNTETNRLSKPNITSSKDSWPLARRAHSAVLFKSSIVIFGGGNGSAALNDVWALDVSDPTALRWSEWKSSGDLPPPKGYHTATLVGEKLLVYGGSDGTSSFSDVHILNLATMTWTLVETEQKYSRLSHTATQVGSALFCIGGHDGNKYAQEVLLLNLVTLAWEKKPIYGQFPAGRGYHTCCLSDSRIFCLMGYNGQTVFNDVWCLDLAASAYLPQVTAFQIDEASHLTSNGRRTAEQD